MMINKNTVVLSRIKMIELGRSPALFNWIIYIKSIGGGNYMF